MLMREYLGTRRGLFGYEIASIGFGMSPKEVRRKSLSVPRGHFEQEKLIKHRIEAVNKALVTILFSETTHVQITAPSTRAGPSPSSKECPIQPAKASCWPAFARPCALRFSCAAGQSAAST